MKSSLEYLEDALNKLGAKSDTEKAAELKVAKSTLSMYRDGKRIMDNFACIMVAQVLEIDGMEVIAAATMDREKDEERRGIWEDFRKKYGVKMGLAVLAATIMAAAPAPAKAAIENSRAINNIYYVKSRKGGKKGRVANRMAFI